MKELFLSFTILLCGCQADVLRSSGKIPLENTSANTSGSTHQISHNLTNVISGLYFGSFESEYGNLAWLLEFKNGHAKLYVPPNNLDIRNLELKPEGSISFETEKGLGDLHYKFSGQIINDSLEGTIDLFSLRPFKANVTLRRIDTNRLKQPEFYGLFSNVEYIEESGDLVGDELIILPISNDLFGIYTSYENGMISYATKIKRDGNSIKLNIQTEDGVLSFSGFLSLGELRLVLITEESESTQTEIVLPKRREVNNLFEK